VATSKRGDNYFVGDYLRCGVSSLRSRRKRGREGERERGRKMGDKEIGTRERLLQRPSFSSPPTDFHVIQLS